MVPTLSQNLGHILLGDGASVLELSKESTTLISGTNAHPLLPTGIFDVGILGGEPRPFLTHTHTHAHTRTHTHDISKPGNTK